MHDKRRQLTAILLCILGSMSATQVHAEIPQLPIKEPSKAQAGADPMEGHYGNTVIAWGKGWTAHYWYSRDHTYVAFRYKTERDQVQFEGEHGFWDISNGSGNTTNVNDGGLCRHSKIRQNRCMVYGLYQKPGDSWVVWWHNEPQHFEIVPGEH